MRPPQLAVIPKCHKIHHKSRIMNINAEEVVDRRVRVGGHQLVVMVCGWNPQRQFKSRVFNGAVP